MRTPGLLVLFLLLTLGSVSWNADQGTALANPGQVAGVPPGGQGTAVIEPGALYRQQVGGLASSEGTAQTVELTAGPVPRALQISLGREAAASNATQITLRNVAPVLRGDAMLASLWVRGNALDGGPARLMLLFEKSSEPWTKSVSHGISTRANGSWRQVFVPFRAAENYAAGEAMLSLRLAFGRQNLQIADVEVKNMGSNLSVDALSEVVANAQPLGAARIQIRADRPMQPLAGLGGNFAQPRYGSSHAMDAVGQYNLDNLPVAHARVALPLNFWAPEPGVYRKDAQALAALQQLQIMARRQIPTTLSVWEGPTWMLPGKVEESRKLPVANYAACIEAIAQFLLVARQEFGAEPQYFSFNEPDIGVNFRFLPGEMAEFILLAGQRFEQMGIRTRFLVGDTASGAPSAAYSRELLEDSRIQKYLGPIAFHSWDVLSASESSYAAIGQLGREFNKPVWCTEAGHDAQLWRRGEWDTWQNALSTALAYERTLRLSGAERLDYWTYQDNYPLVSKDGKKTFPVWHVLRQLSEVLAVGSRLVSSEVVGESAAAEELRALVTRGPGAGRWRILIINPVGTGEVTVFGLPKDQAFRVEKGTSRTQFGPVTQQTSNAHGELKIDVPAGALVMLTSVS